MKFHACAPSTTRRASVAWRYEGARIFYQEDAWNEIPRLCAVKKTGAHVLWSAMQGPGIFIKGL
jgi:hypothetical protein